MADMEKYYDDLIIINLYSQKIDMHNRFDLFNDQIWISLFVCNKILMRPNLCKYYKSDIY